MIAVWMWVLLVQFLSADIIPSEPVLRSSPQEDAEGRSAHPDALHEGIRLALEERYEAAIPLLEQAIAEDPARLEAWEALGWAYWYIGEEEKTLRLWERLRIIDPRQPRVLNLLASYYLRLDQLEESIEWYQRSLELHPAQSEIRFQLAQAYRWSGRLIQAIGELVPLVDRYPDRLDMRTELARALTSNWNYEQALTHWQIIRAADPEAIEYLVAEATVSLHVGDVDRGRSLAASALEVEPDHVIALQVLADAGEFSDAPEDGLPWLFRMLEAAPDEGYADAVRSRLSSLLERLYVVDSDRSYLLQAIDIQSDRIAADAANVDALLRRAELQLAAGRYEDARSGFENILSNINPNSQRATRGVFEIYFGSAAWDKAEEALQRMSRLNPADPYLHVDWARLSAARGRFRAAHAHLNELEAAGRRGAVAVLLYHSLGTSAFGQAPSQQEFHDQLLALREAGYEFLTPNQMAEYLAAGDENQALAADGPPHRYALVTFDDALITAMQYGTPVGRELGIPFAQHIIVRNTDRGDAYLSSWDELRDYQASGVWSFGSHSYYAHQPMPLTEADEAAHTSVGYHEMISSVSAVDEVARRAYPLGNRIWRPDLGRVETRDDFIQRLHLEYGHSRQAIERELDRAANFFAYPFGEIGQQAASNEPDALQLNMEVGSQYYDMGFLQSYYGHAVHGDHPMLYQRHEMALRATGEETVRYFLDRNPVYLAQRLRLRFAVEEGDADLIRQARTALIASEYPYFVEGDVQEEVVSSPWTPQSPPPWRVTLRGEPFVWQKTHTYARIGYEGFEDHLDSRFDRFSAHVGANLAPNVWAEVTAGVGQYEQDSAAEAESEIGERVLKVDEGFAGFLMAVRYPQGITLTGKMGARWWSGDADDVVPRIALQAQGVLSHRMEWLAGYDHDAVPAARAMAESVTHHTLHTRVIQHFGARASIGLDGSYHDISDGNVRYHLDLYPRWRVSPRGPLALGVRYSYSSSDEARTSYWTPYQAQAIYGEAILQYSSSALHAYVSARVGMAEESIRPETRRAFDLRQQQAVGGQVAAESELEDSGWDAVFGASASISYEMTPRWVLIGAVSYFESVEYNQTDVHAAMEVRF